MNEQMREILDIINEMSEEEGSVELQDSFSIELGEDLIIESGVVDINEDGILIEGDDLSLQLLEEHGLILEDADWSKYDEPTVSRVKKGVTKLDRTNYDVPPAMRKDTKGKPGYELRKDKLKDMGSLKEEELDENGLQRYTGIKKYGKKGFEALQKAGREGASEEEKGKIKDQYLKKEKTNEEEMDEAKYHGKEVPLGKKLPGDVKKSKVYVRKPNGKVVKVNFGDKKMRIKKSNPKRRKSFRARHNCANPGPRWKARYWSCRSW